MAVGLYESVASLSRETGDAEGFNPTRIPGLFVMRSSIETRPQCMLYSPALCLIVQGEKEMLVGETRTVFREGQSLITTKDVPALVHINKASRDYPFLGLGLELNVTEIRGVMEYLSNPLGSARETGFELFVEDTSKQLEDCVIRLFDASHRPNALAILHPSIMREVYYWLLTGPNGAKITRQIGNSGVSQRISKVIHRLKETFRQPLKVDQLAQIANMSPSSFFHHFKTITSIDLPPSSGPG